jgi:hypothetical protein
MRIGGCRWMVGDAVEGQLSLAMSKVVGIETDKRDIPIRKEKPS